MGKYRLHHTCSVFLVNLFKALSFREIYGQVILNVSRKISIIAPFTGERPVIIIRRAVLLFVVLSVIAPVAFAAGILPDQPIMFVTQVPTPDNINNVASTFGNHEARSALAPRGGDLMIRYIDGSVKNLTAAAGFGNTGLQGANSIAVRQPCVHWSGTKAVFSMVVGSPVSQNDSTPFFWQLYEVSNFGQGQTPVITKVANQPANCNSISPIYGTNEHIIFICDRARNGAGYLYPQMDEYRLDTTNTGLWNLDPQTGALFLMSHNPSGSFWPTIDSYGRVVLTRWDHLERDVTADADTVSNSGTIKGTFNYSDESAGASSIPRQEEVFPEPSPVRPDLIAGTNLMGFEFNQFFPWTINEDGTGEETLNHIGRHELRFAIGKVFTDDPNLVGFSSLTSQPPRFNPNFINNMLQIREDPAHPGIYFGVDANEFGTHAAGQIYSLNGPLGLAADQMKVSYITDRSTEGVTQEGGNPQAQHSGHYRTPTPFANGALVCAHTLETHADFNIGTTSNPVSRYNFRIKNMMQSGNVWVSDQTLTPGFTANVSYYTSTGLITYNLAFWELDPVVVTARTKPVAAAAALGAPEQAIFDQEGVNVANFKSYMSQNNLALIVSRNLTTRDKADKQQPFNLHVAGSNGVQTIVTSGKVYDISALQIFQADQLRGLTGTNVQNAPPLPGRRPVPVAMHDSAVNNPPNAGGPAGSVKISTLDGSMAAFVPVRRAMTWQMTDPTGTPVVRERYWLTFQPGEIRTCTSCHGINSVDQNNAASPQNSPEALRDLLKYWKQTTAVVAGSVKFNSAAYSVSETAGTATITVSRIGGSSGAISVQYATSDGTAVAPAKYTATSGTLNWADTDSADKTFTIPIKDNTIVDGNTTVNITLSAPTNGAVLAAPSAAVLTIIDNEAGTPPAPPQFASGPTATPNPAQVNTSVTLACVVSGTAPILIAWNLGDGTLLPGSAATSVSHTYQTAGQFTVIATLLDGNGKTASGQTVVTITTGTPPPPPPQTTLFSVTHGSLHFNFKTHKDTCTITGTLPLGTPFSATGQHADITLGTLSATISLSGASSSNDKIKMGKAPKGAANLGALIPFTLTLKNQDLFSSLSAAGFSNADVSTPASISVPLNIVIGSITYHADIPFTYTAKAGKTGSASK